MYEIKAVIKFCHKLCGLYASSDKSEFIYCLVGINSCQ